MSPWDMLDHIWGKLGTIKENKGHCRGKQGASRDRLGLLGRRGLMVNTGCNLGSGVLLSGRHWVPSGKTYVVPQEMIKSSKREPIQSSGNQGDYRVFLAVINCTSSLIRVTLGTIKRSRSFK